LQRERIQAGLERRDLLVVMPTRDAQEKTRNKPGSSMVAAPVSKQ